MTNTLYLPELREMLAEQDDAGLKEFCQALHPARLAEFMDGLSPDEAWAVLLHTDPETRVEIFRYFDLDMQVMILETVDRSEMGPFIGELPADERVDLLNAVAPETVQELLPLVPEEERRDIQRLKSYEEETAGAVMTSDFARLSESQTVQQTLDVLRKKAADHETIYYLYVVDDQDHLRGLVSLRELVLAPADARIADIMQRDIVTVDVTDDQEVVANQMAHFNFLAIPVVDEQNRLVGIVTHDDVIDVVRDEATEDAHRIGGLDPLDVGYLQTHPWTLAWKRGVWLTILFFGAMFTAILLHRYEQMLAEITWLVLFLPLVISSGGNSGSQSATLIITGLSTGNVELKDWFKVARRELLMGITLGGFLGALGYVVTLAIGWNMVDGPSTFTAVVIPLTLVVLVVCSTLVGSLLPLLFRRLRLDPALMSTPVMACLVDNLGIIIYMLFALSFLEFHGP